MRGSPEDSLLLASLARLFLPSWRFFDDALDGVVLKVRLAAPGAVPGPWREVLAPPRRRLLHLLWNPEGNRVLASYSLLERLLLEASEERTSASVTWQLVEHLARREAARLPGFEAATRFEFVVCDRRREGDEALIASPLLPCR